jgi:hypothetical protein
MPTQNSPTFRLLCTCALLVSLTASTGCSQLASLFGKKAAADSGEEFIDDDTGEDTDVTDEDIQDDVPDMVDVPDVKKDAAPDAKKDTKDVKDSGPDLQDEPTDLDVEDDATDDAADAADDVDAQDSGPDVQDTGPDVASDVGFDTGVVLFSCKVDLDCGSVTNVCAAQWLCLIDPDTQKGTCVAGDPQANGTACDDGSVCTQNDVCNNGTCLGKLNTCEDGNPCTVDKCVASNGTCTHNPPAPNGPSIACSDGDPCTIGDTCVSGTCSKFTANICDCKVDADCTVQDSADLCTPKHVCTNNACVLGTPKAPCAKSTVPCQNAACDPTSGECILVPAENGAACTDGDICTYPDLCVDGTCGSEPLACNDGNPCTDDSCVPGKDIASGAGCKYANNTAACDDGDDCTGWGQCAAGACTKGALDTEKCGCVVDEDCAKLNTTCGGIYHCTPEKACVLDKTTTIKCSTAGNTSCQTLLCDETLGACAFTFSDTTTKCDDGNVCTVGDHCDGGGKCVKTALFSCPDGDPCTFDYCNPSVGCYHPYNTAPCDDGDACTGPPSAPGKTDGDHCAQGKCLGSPYTDATKLTLICQCQVDTDCKNYDANKCQAPHKCSQAHICTLTGSVPPDPCAAIANKSPCKTYACKIADGTCAATNKINGLGCSDGKFCTSADVCSNGDCLGTPNLCDDGNVCTTDASCAEGPSGAVCDHPPVEDDTACVVDNVCQLSPSCQSGACIGTAKVCDDKNPCTVDACDPKTGCKFLPTTNGTLCDDANPCTGEDGKDPISGGVLKGVDTCVLGKCVAGKAKDCKVANTGPCYTSTCDPSKGGNLDALTNKYACVQNTNTAPCQGGDKCIVNQACLNGVCAGGSTKNCDDANICTDDSCWSLTIDPLTPPGTCIHSALGLTPCDDLNLCTTKDACSLSGVCGGKLLIFDDGNPCTLDSCDAVSGPKHTTDPNGDCGPLAKCSSDDPPKCVFASKPILISEFYVGVPNNPSDDWIEIHNPTSADVSIPSYAIQVAEAKPGDGIGWNTLATTDSAAKILAHGYLLFSHGGTVLGGQATDIMAAALDFNHAQQVDGKGVGIVDANSAPVIIKVGQVRLFDAKNGLVQDRLCLDAGGCTDMGVDITPVTLAIVSANSLERKANAGSTQSNMAFHGSQWLAGNDYVDGAMPNDNFFVRLMPDPQTAKSGVYEPACGGNCAATQICNYNELSEKCVDDTNCAIGCAKNSPWGTLCNTDVMQCIPLVPGVLFSEVLPGGQNDASQQFIEIYNASAQAMDVSGFVIQTKTADKVPTDPWTQLYQLPAGTVLPSHRYYTLATPAYAATGGGVDALLAGSLGLDPAGAALRLWDPRTTVELDTVGWGNALSFTNGSNASYKAAPAPTPGNSLERKSFKDDYNETLKPGGINCLAGNAYDNDNDETDWTEQDTTGAQSLASGMFEPACGGMCFKGLICPYLGTDGGKCRDPMGDCPNCTTFVSATSGGGFACNTSLATSTCDLTGLVIAEVSPQGTASTTATNGTLSGANNEYIMLYNRANQDIVLENLYIQYRVVSTNNFLKATDSTIAKGLTGVIHAHSYFLIVPSVYDGKMPAPDFIASLSWGLDPAKGTVRLSRFDTAGSSLTLDHLAWGDDQNMNAFGEPASTKIAAPVCPGVDPVTKASDGTPCAIRRLPMAGVTASDVTSLFSPWYYAGAGYDTYSNKDNFVTTQTRTPRNSCLQANGSCLNVPSVPQKP